MDKIVFPFKQDDIISFPDTDSEYVDVGIGADMKVAETPYENLCRVVKRGKGLSLQLIEGDYSEIFLKYRRKGRKKDLISLKQYIDYFGNFDDLKFCTTWEDYELTAEQLEEKYNL